MWSVYGYATVCAMGLFTAPPNLVDLADRAVKALERIADALEARRPEPEPEDAVPLAR